MSDPSDTEWLALAHEQAHEIMKCCDELIAQADRELAYFALRPAKRKPRLAACVEHKAGRFGFASLTERPSVRATAANLN
jgi:hypothetical protein